MRFVSLQLLTWGTAATAVSSAVWLSSTSQHALLCALGPHASAVAAGLDVDLPPTSAGASGPAVQELLKPQGSLRP